MGLKIKIAATAGQKRKLEESIDSGGMDKKKRELNIR